MFGQATKGDAKINQRVRMLKNRWIIVERNILPLENSTIFQFKFLRYNLICGQDKLVDVYNYI